MSYQFNASHVFAQEDDYMVMIGFANDENEPTKFVILQKAKEYDEQDKRMGMDKIHIQVEDESRSLYGGIMSIERDGEKLLFKIDKTAESALKIAGNIEINLDLQHPELPNVLSKLNAIADSAHIPFNNKS